MSKNVNVSKYAQILMTDDVLHIVGVKSFLWLQCTTRGK